MTEPTRIHNEPNEPNEPHLDLTRGGPSLQGDAEKGKGRPDPKELYKYDINRVDPKQARKDMLRRKSQALSMHIVAEMEEQTRVTASERLMKPIGKVRRSTRVQMQKEQDVYTFRPEMSTESVAMAFEHRQREGLDGGVNFQELVVWSDPF